MVCGKTPSSRVGRRPDVAGHLSPKERRLPGGIWTASSRCPGPAESAFVRLGQAQEQLSFGSRKGTVGHPIKKSVAHALRAVLAGRW